MSANHENLKKVLAEAAGTGPAAVTARFILRL